MTRSRLLLLSLGLALGSACGDDTGPMGTGPDPTPDAGPMTPDMGSPPLDGGTPDPDAGCVPATCADLGETCGTFPDGCGGMVSCTEGCECTDDDFETACPQRPCETLAGCDQGQCQYTPVVCGGAACAPSTCTGEDCDILCTEAGCDDGLYPCGGGTCAGVAEYCDPMPTSEDGTLVYANVCVAPPTDGCGTCDLGNRGCDPANDSFTCEDIAVPARAEGGMVECDSTVAASTFLFVDPEYAGGGSDGSRAAPYTTYDAARSAAVARNARGIVIAGSPVFTEPLRIEDGISVYGGYGSAPGFDPDLSARPVWRIGADHYEAAANRLAGAVAESVTRGTVLSHVRVETADIPGLNDGRSGATNIALFARNAGALHLQDVELEAGAAGAGRPGEDGASAQSLDGADASGRAPGDPGPACSSLAPCTLMTAVPRQDSNLCGYGANGAAPGVQWEDPNPGNPGNPSGTVNGGAGGRNVGEGSFDNCSNNQNNATGGSRGSDGDSGAAGADGRGGRRAVLDAAGRWTGGDGADGQAGQPGTWGGGGGAGGGIYDGCHIPPWYGGHGGGGGGPGCGGDFGTGGGAGGASIGLAAVASSGLTTETSTIGAGPAGRGGDGGRGEGGGQGGQGETNTSAICVVPGSGAGNQCINEGGAGGDGGDGGRGGHGGSGSGGDAVAVYCVEGAIDTSGARLRPGVAGSAGRAPISQGRGEDGVAGAERGCD